ncbi:Exportin-2 [Auxenochlorella protothecoides]|uniref:Exportin-2 n=1 Tax=Auxenochlorella protothecoides TaxID=3075 RepID=A0A087SEI0_AUXPR|nr:Exportin-2 [Auxenochlorella protothecoides]KFM24134.1 Exportin-2 [Auxenochlorella protothecoides]
MSQLVGPAQALHEAFLQTLAPNPELIKQAEAYLKTAAQQPGYGIAVLQLISAESVAVEVRQAAAVGFKNYVKYSWSPRAADGLSGSTPLAIPEGEKDQIKVHITDLMLAAPVRVRSQLSEALSIISSHDFPARWPALLPGLLERLESADEVRLAGVLATADSIYQRYRAQFMTDALSAELDYSQQVVAPLLATLRRLTPRIAERAADPPAQALLLSNIQLVVSIFYSLNSPGLTEAFEETLDGWMSEFHGLLVLEAPGVAEKDPEKQSVLDVVKATICEALILFLERNEEEFAKFLQTFVQDDNLALHAINFLTAVAGSVHHSLFQDPAVLRQVCESIVIPNLRIREDMEELFEMNWVEYVRRDTEGSDSDTRRRAASELVKALTARYPAQTTELFSGYVASMLAEAGGTGRAARWKAKDCAIYLVAALTLRGKTASAGATSTNDLVNLQDFYAQHIAPELAAADVNDLPVLKADALKFATTFRSQLPKATALATFPHLVNLLASESNVVHSYAAIAVDKLLSQREGGALRFQPQELAGCLQGLLERLFACFALPDSSENEYVMKAVMRVIAKNAVKEQQSSQMLLRTPLMLCGKPGPTIAPVAPVCLQQLSQLLLAVCKNPTQPGFNHYLFESVAALVRFCCPRDPASVAKFEEMLFPPFQIVLQEDVQEFHPYIFQVFAQLLETREPGTPLPPSYVALFPPLLSATFWERSGNTPALVRLVRAYLAASPAQVVAGGHLPAVLGIFQKLVASRALDHEGFLLLDALYCGGVPLTALAPYTPHVWTLLFQRLQAARTAKFVRGFVVFTAAFAALHGPGELMQALEAVQAGIGLMILDTVIAPNLANVSGQWEEKLVVVGITKLIVEAPQLQAQENQGVAGKLLDALLRLLDGTSSSDEAGDEEAGVGAGGYSAAFAKLHNAQRVEPDPLPGIKDAGVFLAASLAKRGAAAPGTVPALVAAHVSADHQAKLASLASRAGVQLT